MLRSQLFQPFMEPECSLLHSQDHQMNSICIHSLSLIYTVIVPSHPCLSLQSSIFPLGFLAKILCVFLIFAMNAACPHTPYNSSIFFFSTTDSLYPYFLHILNSFTLFAYSLQCVYYIHFLPDAFSSLV